MAFVSAGAFAREIDLSLYAETLTQTIFAMVGSFNKGPINERTLVSNVSRLQELFGEPIDPSVSSSACQAWFAAREYLKRGNQLYVVRADSAANPAEYAATSLQGTDDTFVATGLDGVTSVPATRTLTSASGTFTTAGSIVLVGDVLEVHEPSGLDNGFYVITNVAATVLTIDRDWPAGSLSNNDFTVWSAQKEGDTDGATSAVNLRQFTSALANFTTNGVSDITNGNAAGDILSIHEPSGSIGDNGLYLIVSVDSQTQLTVDRDWPEGSLSGLDYTIYSSNSRGTDGDTSTDGEFVSSAASFNSHNVQAGDVLWVHDAVDTGDNGFYMITGLKAGFLETTLEVNEATWSTGSLTGLTFDVLPGAITFQSATKGTWANGYNLKGIRNAGDSQNFDLETKNAASTLILEKIFDMDRSDVVADTADNSALWTAILRSNRGEPVTGKTITVSGGDDGYTGIVDSDFIGNALTGTGLQAFKNPELIDINLVAVPGQSSQNVQNAIETLCESRADCFGLLDPPDFPTVDSVQEVIDFTNGTNIRTTALNSSYTGIWWTWQQVYDEFHDLDVWTAPSGHVAAVMANNDNVQAPWFAPAGTKRAEVIGSTDVRLSPDQDDRDSLNGPGQVVNPIVNFVGQGIYVYGQKTCQRTTTALNRINVRRMLLFAEKVIATASRSLVFDPNDEVLEREFKQLAEPVLKDILSKRGIREFRINIATTDQDRENSKAVFQMFIKPQKAAEIIELQFILTPQGANFQELAA
jgi:hypothetical protein